MSVLGVVLALAATGCASSRSPAGLATALPTAAPRTAAALGSPCTAERATPLESPRPNNGPRLPAGFVPVAAYLCFEQQRPYKGDGAWVVLVGQQLVGDLQPLRDALLEPDKPAPPSKQGVVYACAASLVIAPALIVVSSTGQALLPRAPVDYCEDQLPDLWDAIAQLRHVTVQVVKLRQVQTQAEAAATASAVALGCQAAWKDEFSHGHGASVLSPGGPIPSAPATVSLCRYQATAADPLDALFVAGRRLNADQTKQLLAAVTRPGKPGGCSKPHNGILVAASGARSTVEIELGGCSRVLRETGVGRVNAAVIDALAPR